MTKNSLDRKVRINPEWKQAPYELQFKCSEPVPMLNAYPKRFNKLPPDDIWSSKDPNAFRKWSDENEIPVFVFEDEIEAKA